MHIQNESSSYTYIGMGDYSPGQAISPKQKSYMLAVTLALGICLICIPTSLGLCPWALGIRIRQISHALVTIITYV